MQKTDVTGLSPDQIEYISAMEKRIDELSKEIASKQLRIDQLMELLVKSQKAIYVVVNKKCAKKAEKIEQGKSNGKNIGRRKLSSFGRYLLSVDTR